MLVNHHGLFGNIDALLGADGIAQLAADTPPDLEEQLGYYGEKLVLKAQELGLQHLLGRPDPRQEQGRNCQG